MRTVFCTVLISFVTACGDDCSVDCSGAGQDSTSSAVAGEAKGNSQVTDTLGFGFDHESPRARVYFVSGDTV